MPNEFENKIAHFIKSQGLFVSAGKVVLAVSGGADSTALLHVLHKLKMDGLIKADFLCVHINHQLRGDESDGDERFVIDQAGRLNVQAILRCADVKTFAKENKLSIETAARRLRIEILTDIAKTSGCDVIATAHHKDDNAETIIQRLIRGTGFRGLGGIWPAKGFQSGVKFVRPLLAVRRDEIVKYLQDGNIRWRSDRTNTDIVYRRNYIRHRIIPEMQKHSDGSIVELLAALSQASQKFYSDICATTDKFQRDIAECGDNRVILNLRIFSSQHPAVKIELLRRSLASLGSGERDLTQEHYERLLELSGRNTTGKKNKLPGGFIAYYDYGKMIIEKATLLDETPQSEVPVNIPGVTEFGDYHITAAVLDASKCDFKKFKATKSRYVEWFDLEKVGLPLTVRLRTRGDIFIPLGQMRAKKIGKFLTAQHTQLHLRRKTFIIADSKKIIWLCPVRISELTKVSSATKKILRLEIIKN